jgi:hypothetical protein
MLDGCGCCAHVTLYVEGRWIARLSQLVYVEAAEIADMSEIADVLHYGLIP